MMFDQEDHWTHHEDGPTFLVKLLSMTTTSTLQMALQAMKDIQNLDPAAHSYNIPIVNSTFNRLFILATTGQRALTEPEKLQHILTGYARIKQPEEWAQWVLTQMDAFDQNNLTNAQAFMNLASLKYQKIASQHGSFNGRPTTEKQDILAMMSLSKNKPKRQPPPPKDDLPAATPPKKPKRDLTALPPFATWYKKSGAPNAPTFKHGDTKDHNNHKWYFCEYPNHLNRVRWHPFDCANCRQWKKWKAAGGNSTPPPPATPAPAPAANPAVTDTADTDEPAADPAASVTALLAQAMSLSSGNDAIYGAIADVLTIVEHS